MLLVLRIIAVASQTSLAFANMIWNDGEILANLDSTHKLFIKHSSKPYNPRLANIFFKVT